jgi:DNA adenine methylase
MKPFLKWAGGKTKLVPTILARVPVFEGSYHEPFVGGGAVFMALHAAGKLSRAHQVGYAVLNDVNAELMNAYAVVQDGATDFVKKLLEIKHSKETYYKVRAKEETEPLARAVRFCYLNKTCFNGLYRVNRAGHFNVPIGDYKNPVIVEPDVVAAWHAALAGVTLRSEDFEPRILAAKRGDFIYVDPPYLPRSKTADFTSYTADRFALKEHERLAAALVTADRRGAKFIASQGDSETIRALYKEFGIESVSVTHAIAAKKASRVKVGEVLISNVR